MRAAVRVIIPESVIDDMINHTGQYTVEQYQSTILDDDHRTFRPIGILGDVVTMEQAQQRQQAAKAFGSAKVSMSRRSTSTSGLPAPASTTWRPSRITSPCSRCPY
jgi:hypothetical protein